MKGSEAKRRSTARVKEPAARANGEPAARPRSKRQQAPAQGQGRPTAAPSMQEIAERAYQRYLARGGGEGSADADWFAAEAELGERRGEQRL